MPPWRRKPSMPARSVSTLKLIARSASRDGEARHLGEQPAGDDDDDRHQQPRQEDADLAEEGPDGLESMRRRHGVPVRAGSIQVPRDARGRIVARRRARARVDASVRAGRAIGIAPSPAGCRARSAARRAPSRARTAPAARSPTGCRTGPAARRLVVGREEGVARLRLPSRARSGASRAQLVGALGDAPQRAPAA